MSILVNKRILVVEDEAIVADMLESFLAELGAVVVGPAGTVARGMALAREESIDAAILDVNIRDENVVPVAALLRERNIPIVFATGYGDEVTEIDAGGATIIGKPYTKEHVEAALGNCFAS